jgi:hypothetical protein
VRAAARLGWRYILVAVIAMRVLIGVYDTSFLGAVLLIAAGTVASLGVAMAFR